MSNENPNWTDERVEKLKQYWTGGLSAGQIAARLGGGLSRNAVIGKAHRVGLTGHIKAPQHGGGTSAKSKAELAKPKQSKPVKFARPPVLKAVPMPPPPVDLPEPTPLNLKLFELGRKDCRWPISGEKENLLFCGHDAVEGSSYCLCHKNRSVGQGTRSEHSIDRLVRQVA